jgi:hypothetical protein
VFNEYKKREELSRWDQPVVAIPDHQADLHSHEWSNTAGAEPSPSRDQRVLAKCGIAALLPEAERRHIRNSLCWFFLS